MGKIYSDISELIGRTPIMELKNVEKMYGLKAKVFAKLEYFNPAGSAKDRAAKRMIEDALNCGALKMGGTIIEPTSGNTGIGLAAVGVPMGFKVIIIMPDTMSEERILTIRAYGAEVILTPGRLGMKGAIEKAEELKSQIEGSFIPDQFNNRSNALAHFDTTGPEIYEDMDGEVDYFVAGIGTGGTITGIGEYLKSKNEDIRIIGMEPLSSPFISKGEAGPHKIQGIGAGFIPGVLNMDILDEVVTVSDESAYDTGSMLARAEGLLVGISSGAALSAAIELAKREECRGKNIVVLLPDTGCRYLSTGMFG